MTHPVPAPRPPSRRIASILLALAATVGLIAVATPAEASPAGPSAQAVAIRCSTKVYRYQSTGKVALQVLGNPHSNNRVHAFWVYRYGSSTPRKIIPTYSIWGGPWPYPVYRIVKVRSWQSGTECSSWWVGR